MDERRDRRAKGRDPLQVSSDLLMLSRFAPRQELRSSMQKRAVLPHGANNNDGLLKSSRRSLCVIGMMSACFLALGVQLVSLALRGQGIVTSSMSSPIATSFARPDIVDRQGRLIATDVVLPSLYADPTRVLDRDEVVETLKSILPEIDEGRLRKRLADKKRHFIWIRRKLSTRLAQKIHDAGLPGLSFRPELKRAYPMGRLAGHLLGAVDYTN